MPGLPFQRPALLCCCTRAARSRRFSVFFFRCPALSAGQRGGGASEKLAWVGFRARHTARCAGATFSESFSCSCALREEMLHWSMKASFFRRTIPSSPCRSCAAPRSRSLTPTVCCASAPGQAERRASESCSYNRAASTVYPACLMYLHHFRVSLPSSSSHRSTA